MGYMKKQLKAFAAGFDHRNPKRHENLKCKMHFNTSDEGASAPVMNMLRSLRNEHRFEEIVTVIEEYKQKPIYNAVGERVFVAMADVLTNNISSMSVEQGEEFLLGFRAWAQRQPSCPYALVSLAEALVQVGWLYRGSGYANTVTEAGWQKLQHYVQESEAIMRSAQGYFSEHWYWALIALGQINATGAGPQGVLQRYSHAIRLLPLSPTVMKWSTSPLLPRWSGNYEIIEQFADRCAKETQHKIGEGAYSIIYSKIIDHGEDVRDLHINLDRFGKGCKDWLSLLPNDYQATVFATDAYLLGHFHLCLDLLESLDEFHYEAFETGEELTFVNAVCRVETGR